MILGGSMMRLTFTFVSFCFVVTACAQTSDNPVRTVENSAGQVVNTTEVESVAASDPRAKPESPLVLLRYSFSEVANDDSQVPDVTLVFNRDVYQGNKGLLPAGVAKRSLEPFISLWNSVHSPVENIEITDWRIKGWGSPVITVDLPRRLAPNMSYHLTIEGGALVDSDGRKFEGIQDPSVVMFSTALRPLTNETDLGRSCLGFPSTVKTRFVDDTVSLALHAIGEDTPQAASDFGYKESWLAMRPDMNWRWSRGIEHSWVHEFHRLPLDLDRLTHSWLLPESETVHRIGVDVELQLINSDGQLCSVVLFEDLERSDARYPTEVPNLPGAGQLPDYERYASFIEEGLPDPDVQAVMIATSWWEDYGPPFEDGREGYYLDQPIEKSVVDGTPMKVALYGVINEHIIQDFADAFEILAVIAPSLQAGFASTPEEVTLSVHFIDNCGDESYLGADLYADLGCENKGFASTVSRNQPFFGKSYGSIQVAAADWQRRERELLTWDKPYPSWYQMRTRQTVFHEFGHILGLSHNRCVHSSVRAPNSHKQHLGWSAEDLKGIAAIHDVRVPQGSTESGNDYDTDLNMWKPDGAYGNGRLAFGPEVEDLGQIFGLLESPDWDRMQSDRQSMCEVDLSGTFWDRLAHKYEEKYQSDPRYADWYQRQKEWSSWPDFYEAERIKDPRACC